MLRETPGTMLIFTKIGCQFSASMKRRVWAAFGGKGVALCWACGAMADEIDHLKPRKAGGGNDFKNGRPICYACNRNPDLIRPDPDSIEAALEPTVRAIRQVCQVANCDREVYARTLCQVHYQRQQTGYRGALDDAIRTVLRAPPGVNLYTWMLIRRAHRESERSTS